jgi:hypothetical protein
MARPMAAYGETVSNMEVGVVNSVFGGSTMWKKTVLPTLREGRSSRVGRDNAVGLATCYGLDGPGNKSQWGPDFPHPSRPAMGLTQPPIQWVPSLSRG